MERADKRFIWEVTLAMIGIVATCLAGLPHVFPEITNPGKVATLASLATNVVVQSRVPKLSEEQLAQLDEYTNLFKILTNAPVNFELVSPDRSVVWKRIK